ncbi:ubiquinone biosynthesis hydrox [Neolentinus lepideus HHB14362 ss-1]|uniref:Ubiquinone biosynthesis hydrox n=1 Tax=Neolentinus lepideus HHB14362 ss-1 TaxID=1314782 RepID=A0A165SJ88_9AGAM|nr:ubiquinone biosynthesis hydrox [Neolentinus lepideus HHB14362 ss-1]
MIIELKLCSLNASRVVCTTSLHHATSPSMLSCSNPHVRSTISVVLIEAGDLAKIREWAPQEGLFSNRVSSITNASQTFLEGIGAWQHVDESRTMPMEEMQVWDGLSDARITYTASELGFLHHNRPQMARLTENLNLQRALLRYLSSLPEVRLFDNTKVSNIAREGGGSPLVNLSTGRVLRARLLVGADGHNSPVRSYAHIDSYGWSYPTHAVVATLTHAPRPLLQNRTAYQRFLPTGPIAFLPLSPTTSSLVWSTRPALARVLSRDVEGAVLARMVNAAFRLPETSLRYLHQVLTDAAENASAATPAQIEEEIAFRERAHAIPPTSPLSSLAGPTSAGLPPEDAELYPPLVTGVQSGTAASFPLRYSHADAYVGARTVLVGDAAHTVHPLAGQGLNMGLMDVAALAGCVADAVRAGGDIGAYTALAPYARARYLENHKLLSAVDKLHKLYASTAAPLVWARSVGLEVVNELDAVKAALMMSAGADSVSVDRERDRVWGSADPLVWGAVAKGVEGLAGAVGAAAMLGQVVKGAVGNGIQGLLRDAAEQRRV